MAPAEHNYIFHMMGSWEYTIAKIPGRLVIIVLPTIVYTMAGL
jgi:hypothetical protein